MLLPLVKSRPRCKAGSETRLAGALVALRHLAVGAHSGLSLIIRVLRETRVRLND